MAELNWTVITYFVVGIFALNGFFRGWWKEAVTTVFLAVLVFLLHQPGVAELFISIVNSVLNAIWNALPADLQTLARDGLEAGLGLTIASTGGIQLSPGDANTWFMVLLVFLILAILIGRLGLTRDLNKGSGYFYAPTMAASVLGAVMGMLNGFLLSNIVREYLDGRSLPGSTTVASTGQVAFSGSGSIASAAPAVGIQATDLPNFTILDSFLPWVVIIVGLLIFFSLTNARYKRDGLNFKVKKGKDDAPFGYKFIEVVPKPPPDKK